MQRYAQYPTKTSCPILYLILEGSINSIGTMSDAEAVDASVGLFFWLLIWFFPVAGMGIILVGVGLLLLIGMYNSALNEN